ncbi:MAG: ABC transporter permease [Spirochaetaceae bacterium]|nr:MAG: ABC transporter permease [Spirochaetaceae bacterium]
MTQKADSTILPTGARSRPTTSSEKVRAALTELGFSAFAIFLALVISALLMVILGYNVALAYQSMFRGAFGSLHGFSQTLLRATPLLFTGFAVAIAFRAGLFNIGAEGQLYWGALACALVALTVEGMPKPIAIGLPLLAAGLAGFLWGAIPGILKAKTGAHEVITSIMLNSIAIFATTHITSRYFKAPGAVDQTERIVAAAVMPQIIPGTGLTAGILLGIAVAALVAWFFGHTALGYDFQAVGRNADAAEYGGVSSKRIQVLAMGFGGIMAGVAGGIVVLSLLNRFVANFSPGYGFTGIAVAVLGRGNPWGVVLAALLFGALDSGGMSMQLFARIPSDLTIVVQGLVIILVAAPAALRAMVRWRKPKVEPVDVA